MCNVVRITGQTCVAELVNKTVMPRLEGNWYSLVRGNAQAGWACICHGAQYKTGTGMAIAIVTETITADEPGSCRKRPSKSESINMQTPGHDDYNPDHFCMKDEMIARCQCLSGQVRNLIELLKLGNNNMLGGLKIATQTTRAWAVLQFKKVAKSNSVATLWLDRKVPTLDIVRKDWSTHEHWKNKQNIREAYNDKLLSSTNLQAGIKARMYDLSGFDSITSGEGLSNASLLDLMFKFTDAMDMADYRELAAIVARIEASEDSSMLGETRNSLFNIATRVKMIPGKKLQYMESECNRIEEKRRKTQAAITNG